MANYDDIKVTLMRGGYPALGSKVGVLEATITAADLNASGIVAGDTVTIATAEGDSVVLSAGIDVTAAGATSSTVDLGTGSDGDLYGSGLSTAAVANVGAGIAPQFLKAGETLTVTGGSTGPGADAVLRVWAVIADVADLKG